MAGRKASKKSPKARVSLWHKVRRSPRFSLYAVVIVVIVLALAGYYAYRSRAAFGPGSVAVSTLTLGGGANTVSDSAAKSGSVVQFGANSTSSTCPAYPTYPAVTCPQWPQDACPAYPAYPTTACVGWQHTGVTLVPYTGGQTIATDGEVISGVDINMGIDVRAANVTFQNCRFRLSDSNGRILDFYAGATNFKVVNCEFDGLNGQPYGQGHQVVGAIGTATGASGLFLNDYIHGSGDGIDGEGEISLVSSIITGLDDCCGYHSDGIQMGVSASNQVFHHNVLELPDTGGTTGLISYTQSNGDHVTIDQNLMHAGNGFCFDLGGNSYFRVINNRCSYVNGGEYKYPSTPPINSVVTGNVDDVTGKLIDCILLQDTSQTWNPNCT